MELSKEEFDLLREYVHNLCGLVIPDTKAYLVRQRLESVAEETGCASFAEFHKKVGENRGIRLQEKIINAITTNETSFFRDEHPFSVFQDNILPHFGEVICQRKFRRKSRKGSKVRFWSAGASSGQEPYSIAMLIREFTDGHLCISPGDFGILATDISSGMLARAMAGEYGQAEIRRGISPERQEKYFRKEGTRWVIDSSVRSMVEFRQINLIRPFVMLGGFDVIFCRNVLIYFDLPTKVRIVEQFCRMLSDTGFLILGATENIYAVSDRFDSVYFGSTLLYQKKV